jgi:hypothetical protein
MADPPPSIPARPKDSELVTAFTGSLQRSWLGGTANGEPIVKIVVDHEDKWLPMRLDEAVGFELFIEIRKRPGSEDDDALLDRILGEMT